MKNSFLDAKEQYAAFGVDVETAIKLADNTPISLHCWQGDDVGGFEGKDTHLSGGIEVTGNYPYKARSLDELRTDLEKALSLIPGTNKVNVHANYIDNGGKYVDRNEIEVSHFASWADFAVHNKIGLDFNSTFFSHEKSGNYTLSNSDKGIRDFWIDHAKRARKISEYFGSKTGQTCITNLWIHDGEKEIPIDTLSPRMRLKDSLDQIFSEKLNPSFHKDAVESKLFGIGSEGYVTGSNEFYVAYCMSNPDVMPTLDAGHFHPTEVISAKISALLPFMPSLLLHVSRPVRWDSDHVVLFDDETRQIMREVVRADALNRVYIATDYFDASINRLAAWTVGARNTRKALLAALLEPTVYLKELEQSGDLGGRLLMSGEAASLPFNTVWEQYCEQKNIPTGKAWLEDIKDYEKSVLSKRV